LEKRSTSRARLTGPTVRGKHFEPFFVARSVAVGELLLDRRAQSAHDFPDVAVRERVASRARIDARLPERLGRQDVADACEDRLVHEGILDGAAASTERLGERTRVDAVGDRVRSELAPLGDVFVCNDEATETARIQVAHARRAPVGLDQVDPRALGRLSGSIGEALDPMAGHAEVGEELAAVVELDPEPFSTPADRPHASPGESAPEGGRRFRAEDVSIGRAGCGDGRPAHPALEAAPRKFHVGELGHGGRGSAGW
jgi:hypothetical protein